MPQFLETHLDQFTISADPSRLDMDAIADLLSRSYWANTRTREQIERALSHSIPFGLYDGERQIGLARVITDYTIFAYLCDVILHEDYRGRGLGKWLMATVHNHPDLRDVRRWMLATDDAHGMYRQFGWTPLEHPERWMMKFDG